MLAPAELSPDFWNRLVPVLEGIESGGIVLVAIEPLRTENRPRVTFGAFTAAERKALKTALNKAKTKREKISETK